MNTLYHCSSKLLSVSHRHHPLNPKPSLYSVSKAHPSAIPCSPLALPCHTSLRHEISRAIHLPALQPPLATLNSPKHASSRGIHHGDSLARLCFRVGNRSQEFPARHHQLPPASVLVRWGQSPMPQRKPNDINALNNRSLRQSRRKAAISSHSCRMRRMQ
uniref:Uncharacterized protein TCIL3000_11_12630 n=1 Tax=Trypanosoma congolense (strain IL3000) TaxID=1068625 RepID=G0V295_TRYCI|nr:unnamed protein product [Trypanosoma congolense IL3000]